MNFLCDSPKVYLRRAAQEVQKRNLKEAKRDDKRKRGSTSKESCIRKGEYGENGSSVDQSRTRVVGVWPTKNGDILSKIGGPSNKVFEEDIIQMVVVDLG